jgi:hypothetical protein
MLREVYDFFFKITAYEAKLDHCPSSQVDKELEKIKKISQITDIATSALSFLLPVFFYVGGLCIGLDPDFLPLIMTFASVVVIGILSNFNYTVQLKARQLEQYRLNCEYKTQLEDQKAISQSLKDQVERLNKTVQDLIQVITHRGYAPDIRSAEHIA